MLNDRATNEQGLVVDRPGSFDKTYLLGLGAGNAGFLPALGAGYARFVALGAGYAGFLATLGTADLRIAALSTGSGGASALAGSLAGRSLRRLGDVARLGGTAAPAGIVQLTTTMTSGGGGPALRGAFDSCSGFLPGLATAYATRTLLAALGAGNATALLAALGTTDGHAAALAIVRAVSGGIIRRRDFVIAILLGEADTESDDERDYGEGGNAKLEEFLFDHGGYIEE